MFRHLTDAFRALTETLIAWGPAGILVLSILDSGGIPVAGVFDALLIFIAVNRPGSAWLCAGLAVTGSVIGNSVLFFTARRGGRKLLNPEPKGRAAKFRGWFRRYGLITVFVPALVPIPMPLKLFVISAGALGTPKTQFIAVILTARVLRYFGEAWLGVALGKHSDRFLETHALDFVAGAVLIFVVLYLYVVIRDRGRAENL